MAKEGELHFTLFFFIYFYFFLVLRVLKTDGYFLGNRNIKYMPKLLIKQPFLLCALNLAGSYSLITLLFLPLPPPPPPPPFFFLLPPPLTPPPSFSCVLFPSPFLLLSLPPFSLLFSFFSSNSFLFSFSSAISVPGG